MKKKKYIYMYKYSNQLETLKHPFIQGENPQI